MFEKMDRGHPVNVIGTAAFSGGQTSHGGYQQHHLTSGGGMGIAVVPMKLYANWEVDRASSSAVQRVLTLVVNRLILPSSLKADTNFSVAARLQGHKRTLRSNDINLPQSLITSTPIDINLDISFTIQYSHYWKRKSNVLQILIQRRKRYKNRHIPGFKTLAIGHVNLDDVLQYGGERQIQIWDTAYLNKTEGDLNDYGTVFIANCHSQAVDTSEGGGHKISPKDGGLPMSEEDDDDTSEESDFEVQDDDGLGQPSGSKTRIRSTRKKLNQKNIKSKLTALLKRFKAQDGGAGQSSGRLPPTEEELEEIFEELGNISDSGPEVEPDKMSIISNPKPGLRPFFGSKTDILPPIEDRAQSDESPVETDEQEFSSDNENHPMFAADYSIDSSRSHKSTGKRSVPDNRTSRSSSMKEKNRISHSATLGSMGSAHELKSLGVAPLPPLNNNPTVAGKKVTPDLLSQLEDSTSFIASNIWLSSSSDIPWISKIDASSLKTIRLIDCPNVGEVRATLQNVVGRIQKFCNSNAVSPPQTVIGILGCDRLVTNILRVYVDLLQNKTNQEWLNYLRFTLVIPPNSIIGRSLSTIADGGLLENQWKALTKINPADVGAIEECLHSAITSQSVRSLNIPIGEVMLQLYDSNPPGHHGSVSGNDEKNSENESQVFIPFVAEIHLGNLEELNSLHYVKHVEEETKQQHQATATGPPTTSFASPSPFSSSMSPPSSPQVNKTNDYKELQIEYWTTCAGGNQESPSSNFQSSGNSEKHYNPIAASLQQSKSGGGKFSMKASVRTLSIAREPLSTLLSMLFVKERKKDKVLQKLGRKTKPRSSDSFNSQSRVVSSVTRMICSGKNSPLEISIDGVLMNRIRFFQITSQWQTHVKFFPCSVPSSPR